MLRAVQVVVDEGLAKPILSAGPAVIERRLARFGLRLKPGVDFEIINPESDPRYRDYWTEYYRLTERRGTSQQFAKIEMRRRLTLIGAMMIHMGEADGMLCGTFGTHDLHRHYVDQVIGLRPGVKTYAAMNAVMLPNRTVFIADTYVNLDPTAEQIAEMTLLAAEEIRRFGITPKVALLSHSSFGSSTHPQAKKMQSALALINAQEPELEVEGEMHGDAALSEAVRLACISQLAAQGRRQPADHADARRGQHLVQSAEGRGRQRTHARADSARRRQAGAYPHAVGDRAPHRQHRHSRRTRRCTGKRTCCRLLRATLNRSVCGCALGSNAARLQRGGVPQRSRIGLAQCQPASAKPG